MARGLYGIFVVLSAQAVHALMHNWRYCGPRKTQLATIFLSLTILALFASTTVYMVINVMNYQASSPDDLLLSTIDFCHYDHSGVSGTFLWELLKDDVVLNMRGGTAAVIINIILGDAIVCWRACVIWSKNGVVHVVCGLFLLATLILGILDAMLAVLSDQPALFEDNVFGIAACLLSLTTNLVATLLVAYKAWRSRRRLRGYLIAKAGGSQVGKLFTILIKSGAVYCAIWAVIVAYQFSNYYYGRSVVTGPDSEVHFLDIFGVIMAGALVPVIAIYPTFIIVLVASNRSHMEKGLTRSAQSVPASTHPGNTVAIGCSENRAARRPSVLLISRSRQGSGEDSMDDTSTNTGEELKLECII
ncbi:hypothetical protein V8D89_014325 [Ganoderma adspersum]